MRLLPVLLVSAVFLAGCGAKGPLYLPKPKAEKPKRGPVTVPEAAPEAAPGTEAAPAAK